MEGGQHQIGALQLADSWRRPTSLPRAGGGREYYTSMHFNSPQWGMALQCPTVGAPHFNAPQWGRGTSTPHSGGRVLQCPTVGHGTSMPHSGRLARQCPTVGARHSNAVRVTVCTLVADKGELPLALSLSVGRCRGRGGVGVVPSGVGVAPSGVGVVPSGVGVGRDARITLTGLNKQADVLCIKTFPCLHAAVRWYKQNVSRLPGMIP